MRFACWLAVSALWVGCGASSSDDATRTDAQSVSGDNCLPLPCPSGSPWSSATCRCERACDFEGEITRRIGNGEVTDCGTVDSHAGPPALQAAQKCALDAQAAQRAFKLKVVSAGIDSTDVQVFASDGAHRSILLHHNDIGGERLSGQLCTSLVPDTSCLPTEVRLCLRCEGLLESSAECTAQNGACNAVGDYEVGKEGGAPCCPGLREVFHQTQASDGTCVDLPLRVSSCIEGHCGDGRCEEQERNPCGGCTLDCK